MLSVALRRAYALKGINALHAVAIYSLFQEDNNMEAIDRAGFYSNHVQHHINEKPRQAGGVPKPFLSKRF